MVPVGPGVPTVLVAVPLGPTVDCKVMVKVGTFSVVKLPFIVVVTDGAVVPVLDTVSVMVR